MRKNLGDKGNISLKNRTQELFEIYQNNEENEFVRSTQIVSLVTPKLLLNNLLIENGDIKTDKKETPNQTLQNAIVSVLLSEDIDEYYDREVRPHLPDSWMDRSKDKVGYEINFTKYFYKFTPLRSLEEISKI